MFRAPNAKKTLFFFFWFLVLISQICLDMSFQNHPQLKCDVEVQELSTKHIFCKHMVCKTIISGGCVTIDILKIYCSEFLKDTRLSTYKDLYPFQDL